MAQPRRKKDVSQITQTFRLTLAERVKLRRLAKRARLSVSGLIRKAVGLDR